MIVRTLAGACAAFSVVVAAAAPAGPAVTRVTITANGARSDDVSGDETVAACRRFRLTPAEVRAYFAEARPVDRIAFVHHLSMSRCHAAGTLRLADGTNGRWFIDLERRGSLDLADGRRRYFYCLSCSSPRFDTVDELDRAVVE